MSDRSITQKINLSVASEPIRVIPLSIDGLTPKQTGPARKQEYPLHKSQHLPPQNTTENTLLSIWVNTHQAMFLSTGIAAQCTITLSDLLNQDKDFNELKYLADLASKARLASAVYTNLPLLTRELYVSYIRKSMKKVHEGFSGVSNIESMMMEAALKKLKQAFKVFKIKNPASYEHVKILYEQITKADKTWWKHHGKSMVKLVDEPISLARMNFKKMKMQKDGIDHFEDYRIDILRNKSALNDYDQYFAVSRTPEVTLEDYRQLLAYAQRNTKSYIVKSGILTEYLAQGTPALLEALDYFESQLEN